ncbi:hypothetical protein N0V88_004259 [Collariella sp. IMI 366227]|nr:hypothetical protein N0V88_004259 [Collariella sp. IMI 366227]
MPPSLPDLASFAPPQPQGQTPYAWPAFRKPAENHAQTGAIDMYVGPTFFRRVDPSCYDPAARLRDMDAAGVDVQVLSTVPVLFCYDAPLAPARVLARALNDHVSGVCAKYPERFVGLGTVPLQNCDAAVEELRRVMGLPGMVGVQIGTSVEEEEGVVMLDDERLEGFWKACEELNVPVFVHPLGYALTKENKGRWGKYWRIKPGQAQIWIDSLLHDPDLMGYVLRKLGPGGASRIVLGSDYPFPLGEVPVAGKMLMENEQLEQFMSWKERAGVLARNAIHFLNLGKEFENRFEKRFRQFEIARSDAVGLADGQRDGWRHRDSAIELDEEDGVGKFGCHNVRVADRDVLSLGNETRSHNRSF